MKALWTALLLAGMAIGLALTVTAWNPVKYRSHPTIYDAPPRGGFDGLPLAGGLSLVFLAGGGLVAMRPRRERDS